MFLLIKQKIYNDLVLCLQSVDISRFVSVVFYINFF